MWVFEARTATDRTLAAVGYLAAVALLVLMQELGLRLRREERRAWWAGHGRDLLNGLCLGAVTGALRAYGFPTPAALATGATVTLLLFGTSVYLETQTRLAHRRAWALGAGLLLATPVLLFPVEILGAISGVAGQMFGLR